MSTVVVLGTGVLEATNEERYGSRFKHSFPVASGGGIFLGSGPMYFHEARTNYWHCIIRGMRHFSYQ